MVCQYRFEEQNVMILFKEENIMILFKDLKHNTRIGILSHKFDITCNGEHYGEWMSDTARNALINCLKENGDSTRDYDIKLLSNSFEYGTGKHSTNRDNFWYLKCLDDGKEFVFNVTFTKDYL